MNTISGWLTALVFFSGSVVANAQLVAVNGGALVNDTSDNLTWLRDGNFFATQATGSGNPAALLRRLSLSRGA